MEMFGAPKPRTLGGRGSPALEDIVGWRIRGKGCVVVGASDVGLVLEHVVQIESRGVQQLLLGDDGNRGADILDIRIDPGA